MPSLVKKPPFASLGACIVGLAASACYTIRYYAADLQAYDRDHFTSIHILQYRFAALAVLIFAASALLVMLLQRFAKLSHALSGRWAWLALLPGYGCMIVHAIICTLVMQQIIPLAYLQYLLYPALFVIPGILAGLGMNFRRA